MDEIKDFVEIMYERWIRADMHYSFTVEINKRFDKFQLPFKLSSGTVIGKGYKTTESIDKILDHRMFERKIAYSEEMIMSTEMLDKKCALDYIVDALQYFISVQRGNGVDKKYAAAAREICSNQDSKIYAVVKAEISEVMKLSNEYFDIRHNEYLNKAKEKREALDDLQFIEYLYNRVYALLYLVRLKVNKADLISDDAEGQENLEKNKKFLRTILTYADEAHHVPADTYQKVMNHFTPKLWLGMTATPDKRDDNMEGRNVYELFNYQIAYEIRLQQAMEEKLLCPFHYFGITDLAIIGDNGDTSRDFSMLTSEERVKHIINQADYYGYSGDKVKGLIFCSNIKETEELSAKFNEMINPSTGKKFRTIALNGSASEQERQNVFERLAMNEEDATIENQPLDYIFSVEILNEGVDIVEVNQVIMLRPTQSPVVFIQQLGRGLRKANGKEYVVILDFIGNYNNNFMIPIALSGDRTYNKDNIRRYIMEGGRVIPGASTVHFDEISRKRIFASVDNANFSDIKLIKENYTNLKNKLGRIPRLHDFDDYGEMDVMRIFDNNSLGSYYKFLVKYEKEYKIRLSEDEEKVIEFVSKKLANGKRIQELQILKRILTYAHGLSKIGLFAGLSEDMREYGKNISQDQKENIVNVMTNKFPAGASKKTYSQCVFMEQEGNDYKPTKLFMQMLANDEFYGVLQELVDFGISRYERDYKNTYDQTDLVLYQKYTYEDVCRLLNWEQNEVPLNIGGYKFDKKTKTFPVFINYDKAEDISDTTKYEDHFIPGFRDRLIAISKSGRNLQSEDVQNFLKAKERGIQVELFVRKNKDDKVSKEFYYLGHMTASGNIKEFTMTNTEKTAVEIEWILDVPVREDIYEYIVNS